MLWILEGDDVLKKNKELQNIKDKVSPDQVVRYDSVNEEVSSLKDSQDLFAEKRLIIVSDASFSDFESDIDAYNTSSHHFVFGVLKLNASQKKQTSKVSYIDCTVKKEKAPEKNLFFLSDVFASKNKKNIWVLYQKAKKQGASEQEIISIIIWQVKMLLVSLNSDQKNSNLNPFVYTKAKKALPLFTKQELEGYMRELTSMYHEARRGQDLSISFERFILSL